MAYKKITIAEIAKRAGVSPTTASMILSGRTGVSFSKETVEIVRRTAAEASYQPSRRHTQPLQMDKTILIACPNISNEYYARVVQAVQQEASVNGIATLIATHYRDPKAEAECIALAKSAGMAGIIFATMPASVDLLEKSRETIPIVVIGDSGNRAAIDTVEVNDFSAGERIASHLATLGHRHIAFVSTSLGEAFAMRQRRLEGLTTELKRLHADASVEIYAHAVSPAEELDDLDIEYHTGYRLCSECLNEKPSVTAFVAVNDSVAGGVIDAILAKGLRIPEDYSVCGFDNIRMSRCEFVSLTTVDHQLEEKARYAFHILHKRICGMNTNRITRVEYPNRLIERRSTGPVRSKDRKKRL